MEDIMDGPGRRELELISDWRNSLIDNKGAMTFRGEFKHPIREVKVPCLQPDSIPNLELVHGGLFYRPVECLLGLSPAACRHLNSFFRSLVL